MANENSILLADEHIQRLCLAALEDASQLDAALQAIYAKGFKGTPQIENVEQLFVQRLKAVRQEYKAQLAAYQENPEQWKKRQLELTAQPDAMVCCLGILISLVHDEAWAQKECSRLLDRRMENGKTSADDNLELLQEFTHTPMRFILADGCKVPIIPASAALQFSGILAMLSYVFCKHTTDAGIVPDLSFDAVCIWSNVHTDALCVSEGTDAETAAIVGCVMSAQYMHISEWSVLKKSMESIQVLNCRILPMIMDDFRSQLLPLLKGNLTYPQKYIWLENPPADYHHSSWIQLLTDQFDRENTDIELQIEEEEESFIRDTTTELYEE